MYDVGLSALVLKICSDYSQSLGLNFPPNVQQEINAIAQWVDTHTVKDISFTQDGNVITVTATTQNNSSQSWVFTLPDINVDKLYTMIKGSNGINVDYSEDRNTLVVSLDKSQEVQSVKLTFPKSATSGTITQNQLTILQLNKSNYIEMVNDNELYYLNDNGHTDGYLTYSHVGIENGKATIKTLTITLSAKSFVIVTTAVPTESGGKLYKHYTTWSKSAGTATLYVYLYSISSISTKYNIGEIANKFISGFHKDPSTFYPITRVITNGSNLVAYYIGASGNELQVIFENIIDDDVTEL